MKTKSILAIASVSIVMTSQLVFAGDKCVCKPSYATNHNKSKTVSQQKLEDSIYAEIYNKAHEQNVKDNERTNGEYVINQVLPYQNLDQVRAEIKSGAYQAMTGAWDWDTYKDTMEYRYRSRGANLGPTLMNRYYGTRRGENKNWDLGMNILEDVWNSQAMPKIMNLD